MKTEPMENDSGSSFVSSILEARVGDQRKSVEVRISAPEKENQVERCTYKILVDGILVRESSSAGDNGIHALMMTLWKIETDLRHMTPFRDMEFEMDDHLGLGFIHSKKVWDSIYK
jgi:hypothetical protein